MAVVRLRRCTQADVVWTRSSEPTLFRYCNLRLPLTSELLGKVEEEPLTSFLFIHKSVLAPLYRRYPAGFFLMIEREVSSEIY